MAGLKVLVTDYVFPSLDWPYPGGAVSFWKVVLELRKRGGSMR